MQLCIQSRNSRMNTILSQERIRPIFAAKAPEIKANPVTGVNEPYFDENKRRPRIVVGIVTVVLMVSQWNVGI